MASIIQKSIDCDSEVFMLKITLGDNELIEVCARRLACDDHHLILHKEFHLENSLKTIYDYESHFEVP